MLKNAKNVCQKVFYKSSYCLVARIWILLHTTKVFMIRPSYIANINQSIFPLINVVSRRRHEIFVCCPSADGLELLGWCLCLVAILKSVRFYQEI